MAILHKCDNARQCSLTNCFHHAPHPYGESCDENSAHCHHCNCKVQSHLMTTEELNNYVNVEAERAMVVGELSAPEQSGEQPLRYSSSGMYRDPGTQLTREQRSHEVRPSQEDRFEPISESLISSCRDAIREVCRGRGFDLTTAPINSIARNMLACHPRPDMDNAREAVEEAYQAGVLQFGIVTRTVRRPDPRVSYSGMSGSLEEVAPGRASPGSPASPMRAMTRDAIQRECIIRGHTHPGGLLDTLVGRLYQIYRNPNSRNIRAIVADAERAGMFVEMGDSPRAATPTLPLRARRSPINRPGTVGHATFDRLVTEVTAIAQNHNVLINALGIIEVARQLLQATHPPITTVDERVALIERVAVNHRIADWHYTSTDAPTVIRIETQEAPNE